MGDPILIVEVGRIDRRRSGKQPRETLAVVVERARSIRPQAVVEALKYHPVVIINKATHEVTYTGTYYYLAHFSKFVRPGAVRVQTTGKSQGVRVIAFQTPEAGFVVQFLNSLNSDGVVNLVSRGRTLGLTLPARSITTATW